MNEQKKICFICLSKEKNVKFNNIFELHLKDSKHFAISDVEDSEDSNTRFVDALRNFTNLRFNKKDTINHYFCAKCEFRFIDAYLLRQEIIQRSNTNRSTIVTNTSDISAGIPKIQSVVVKKENNEENDGNKEIMARSSREIFNQPSSSNNSDEYEQNDSLMEQTLINELNPPRDFRIITMDMITANGKTGIPERHYEKNKIQQDNVGFRMLQKIGWSGGSLGKNMTGIEEPISVDVRTNRQGLGTPTANNVDTFRYQMAYNFLKSYSYSKETCDFIFANEFTERHKNIVFGICKRIRLHTKRVKDTNNFSVLQISKSPLCQ